ncbi:hypothetical protein [Cupriavidus sp. H18C1]|uniref:hypothetical protein n=1 Tax=Cupriavidus sp. H18C1 TaxID=3241601 RepID=UPI003BB86E85
MSKKLLDGLEESRGEREIFDIESADLNAKLAGSGDQVFVALHLHVQIADVAFTNAEQRFLL